MNTTPDPTWGSDAGASLPVAVEVLRYGPLSRAEIGRRLGLSHASLSRLSAPLIERGVIIDIGEHNNGRVGRPTRLLDVDASKHHFLGMKIRETEIIAAVTNMRGDIVAHSHTPMEERTPEAVVARVRAIHAAASGERAITGLGIGIGGAVHERRTVIRAGFLDWSDVPLADLVESATGSPTLVENDVVALCEYEDWFGAAAEDDRFAVITLGIGTGFGLVLNGQPIVNDDYGIGLVGHWPMDPTGPLCEQGHRGCAAALLNSDAIARYATEALGTPVSFDETVQRAADGQPGPVRIIEDAARGLGILVAAVCNLVLPQRVIIAGEGVRLAEVGWDTLVQSIRDHRAPQSHLPPIELSSGDNLEWARGAAVLAIQAFALGRFTGP